MKKESSNVTELEILETQEVIEGSVDEIPQGMEDYYFTEEQSAVLRKKLKPLLTLMILGCCFLGLSVAFGITYAFVRQAWVKIVLLSCSAVTLLLVIVYVVLHLRLKSLFFRMGGRK